MGKVEQLLRTARPNSRRSSIDIETLANLEPLNQLPHSILGGLAQVAQPVTVKKGEQLFAQGDVDPRVFYLLQGQLSLKSSNAPGEIFDGNDLRAKSPLTTEKHRPCTAEALTELRLLSIPSSAWDQALASVPASADGYEVDEIDTADGATWIHNFLKSPVFLRLPAGNIQAILTRLEEVRVEPGQLILKQGSQANNYYVVKEGRFKVARRPAQGDCLIELATLHAGDGFGEEALISHGQRNASVTALAAGALMRLGRQDFTQLLVEPLIRKISFENAQREVQQGGAFLDIRSAEEFRENGLRNATNIPLSLLRANLPELRGDTTYVLYCNDGLLSAAAAFVLNQCGKKAVVLDGGLHGIVARAPSRQEAAPKPAKPVAQRPVAKKASEPTQVVSTAPAPPAETSTHLALEKELADLKSKLDTLEQDIVSPTTQTLPAPESIAQIICVDRDDSLLWTPIPGTAHLSPDKLTLTGELKTSRAARNKQIVCVGEADAILWEPIAGSRQKHTATTSFPDAAPTTATETVTEPKSGWISDNFLWETVIGYSSDPQVDTLLSEEATKARETQKNLKQSVCGDNQRAAQATTGAIRSAPRPHDNIEEAAQQPRKKSYIASRFARTPWWLHGLYLLTALATLGAGYVTFFPNHPMPSWLINQLAPTLTSQTVTPSPAPTASTPALDPTVGAIPMGKIQAEAKSEFTVKKHFAVEIPPTE